MWVVLLNKGHVRGSFGGYIGGLGGTVRGCWPRPITIRALFVLPSQFFTSGPPSLIPTATFFSLREVIDIRCPVPIGTIPAG